MYLYIHSNTFGKFALILNWALEASTIRPSSFIKLRLKLYTLNLSSSWEDQIKNPYGKNPSRWYTQLVRSTRKKNLIIFLRNKRWTNVKKKVRTVCWLAHKREVYRCIITIRCESFSALFIILVSSLRFAQGDVYSQLYQTHKARVRSGKTFPPWYMYVCL